MLKTKGVLILSILLAGASYGAPGAAPAKKPNIVFILADDLGITDISAFATHYTGKKSEELFYETPNLDRLVGNGISFSQAYANQLCAPTRAAIMTGRYASRFGITTATVVEPTFYNQGLPVPDGFNPHDVVEHKDDIKEPQAWINGSSSTALDPSLTTLPKVLEGYRSVFLGKWHLGGHGAKGFQPQDHGFETLAWFDAAGTHYFDTGATDYKSWPYGWNRTTPIYDTFPRDGLSLGSAGPAPHAGYLTDDLAGRAVRFVHSYAEEQAAGKETRPFFFYFCHFAVHTPLEAPRETIDHFAPKPQLGTLGHSNALYAAMVKHLDDSVGRLVDALEETGLLENTLVVFTSDNGGVEYTDPPATDNFPFNGGKGCLNEGGVRVPQIWWMPGRFEGGRWCNAPVNCIDFLPTLAEITGSKIPQEIDGTSILPLLETPNLKDPAPRTFIWHYPFNLIVKDPDCDVPLPLTPHSAIRMGDYKLIWDWHGRLLLFDMAADPYESNDLSKQMPEQCNRMLGELKTWLKANVDRHYMPRRNPDYKAEGDLRPYPFNDWSGSIFE